MKRPLLFAVGLLATLSTHAQSFRMRADVGPVGQPGYHRIMLPPDVVGRLNSNLTDIRLYHGEAEVPYRLTREQPDQSAKLIDFEIVSRTSTPKKTTVVLRNRQRGPLRSMTLRVKNTDSRKPGQLSGSADAKTWYALRDELLLDPTPATNQTTADLRIDIPTSDYDYYRLVISDSLSAPLNILRAGYDATTASPGTYTPIDKLSFTQRDSSDHKTYVTITRPIPARFDKLRLDFPTAGRFARNATVGQYRVRNRRRNRTERYVEGIREFRVSGADSNLVYLPGGLSARDLLVVIDNQDSPPLTVRAVQGFQTTTYLTANLAAGTRYQLRFSAADAPAPAYDLTAFRDLPANLSTIGVSSLRPVRAVVYDAWGVAASPGLVWVGLGLVLALLGYFSVRMLREMDGQKG
ncbi:MAG: hypothetical protein H7Z72_03495 [Bacteroidetes bacterium]|nr:hypothetical protein [Fibrella sp.]